MKLCRCGQKVHAKGRCRACLAYWYRTGRERPDALIVRAGMRALQKEQERMLWRGLVGGYR